MKKKIKLICIAACLVLVFSVFTGCSDEKKAAVSAYKAEVERINSESEELAALTAECDELIAAAETPFDPETLAALEADTASAKENAIEIPKQPSSVEEINALVNDTLKEMSYKPVIDTLAADKKAYEDSILILAQVTAPSEEFVVSRLENVSGITGIEAATEDNDPNGQLGKAGGYTAAVYFSHEEVNQNEISGSTIVEKGTSCGGQIEVYASVEDAEKRNEYLSAFDGTFISSGSHSVVGTMVVRTSDSLKASEQKELEDAIVTVLTALE